MNWSLIGGTAILLWIVMAGVAAVLAALRRWKAFKRAAIAIGALSVVILIAAIPDSHVPQNIVIKRAAPLTSPTFPPYLVLHAGQRAVLDTNNEGDGSHATLFDDMATVKAWAAGYGDPQTSRHHDLPTGTPVVIRSWAHVKEADGDDDVMIDVATMHGPHVEGYVRDIMLIPQIQPGTRLLTYAGFHGGYGIMNLAKDSKAFVKVASATPVALLATKANGGLDVFYGKLLSGPHRGTRGWFSSLTIRAPTGVKGDEGSYDEKCRCTNLFFQEVTHPTTSS
jgi:hypothetical protein